jgi:hypothetical protein
MSAAFTPGPWHILSRRKTGDAVFTFSIGHGTNLYGDGPEGPVATLVDASKDDAHLIEAAPDLYASALEVEAWVKDLGGFAEDGTQPAAVFQRLSNAIAKARGEL